MDALLSTSGRSLRDSVERGTPVSVRADAELIKARYPRLPTFRNHVTAVLAYYKYMGMQCSHAVPYASWKAVHDAASRELQAHVERNEPSALQHAKDAASLCFEDVLVKYREAQQRLVGNGVKVDEPTAMMYLVLSVYAHIVPKRADLGNVRVYRRLPSAHRDDHNYILLHRRAPVLVINQHKTQASHGRIVEALPRAFVEDVEWSMVVAPRRYLFVKRGGDAYDKNNSYAKFVMRAFHHHFGKRIGVTFLRHLYLSSAVSFDTTTIAERRDIARKMGHSLATQSEYRWVEPQA
jgi:hypothetical protein